MKEFATLAEFAAWARERAHMVEDATRLYHDSDVVREVWIAQWLNPDPNEDDCRFCRAMSTCPAAAAKLETVVGAAFSVIAEHPERVAVPPSFTGGHGDDGMELSTKMKAVPFLEDYCIAVRAEVERRLLADVPVEGFALGYGREGPRKWTSVSDVEQKLREFKVSADAIYEPRELKSPTQIEEIAPKRNAKGEVVKSRTRVPILTIEQWDALQPLIKRNPPKPSVQPIGEITKPYVRPVVSADAFSAQPEE